MLRNILRSFQNFTSLKDIVIPKEKLDCRYSRSSGPGGQHVNKTNSKAEIRFNLMQADWMEDRWKVKFRERFPTYLNKEGEVIITDQQSREQSQNLSNAINKLRDMVYECTRPEKAQFVIPPPTENKIRERIERKRHKSDVKQTRQLK